MASNVIQITLQACVLSVASNLLAQTITAYRSGMSLEITWKPIIQFVIFTILSTPPNFLWQQYLEHLLPGQKVVPSPAGIEAASKANNAATLSLPEKPRPLVETRLNVTNTILKFLVDQTLCASVNTIAFSSFMAAVKGATTAQAWQISKQEFWPLIYAGWKLWPWVSLANYSVVRTVEGRTLVGNFAGVAWGVYLALVNAGK